MLKFRLAKKLPFVVLSAFIFISSFSLFSLSAAFPPPALSLPNVPAGLKPYFMLGLANSPANINWMSSSGAGWDARYQYLTGGVNTGSGWPTWNSPTGEFASFYMNNSTNSGYLPIFSYYELLQSLPATGATEQEKDFNNLNNPATMNAYYSDFKLLMDKAGAYGKKVIVHIEPDLWGFMQQKTTNASSIPAAVASSNYADVAAYPNNAIGFAKALVSLRDKYAPNVLLAYHISPWASKIGDVSTSKDIGFDVNQAAQQTSQFYLSLGANFDLFFYDVSDRDAARYALDPAYGNPNHWWDISNNTFPNFTRSTQFAATITQLTGKRGMYWQVPLGNTIYCSMNNTPYHWQDNKLQYYLNPNSTQPIQDLVNAGIMGILFGGGDRTSSNYYDAAGDGVTNPASSPGCQATASADDDGGYLREQAKLYYQRGPIALPGSGGPVFASSINVGLPIALVNQVGNSDSQTFQISNSGPNGTTLTVNPAVLSGTNPGTFNISPIAQFSLASGATQSITVQCTPPIATTYTANLTFTTNDSNRSSVTYSLTCTGALPVFSSNLAPNSSVSLFNKVGSPDSFGLRIANTGHTRTTLNVAAPVVSGANPAAFSISPSGSFNLVGGNPAQEFTISCIPGAPVTSTAILTFGSSAPAPNNTVSYNLSCRGLISVPVKQIIDTGGPDTLSEALTNFSDGQIITFEVPGVQVNGPLPKLKRGTIIDGGSCVGGIPATVISGPGAAQNIAGLVLQNGNVIIRNLKITNFARQQILVPAGSSGNQFNRCVQLKK